MTSTMPSTITIAPSVAAPDRLAHPAGWRARADRVVAEQTAELSALSEVRSASISVEGGPHALVLRVECLMASEVVSLDVMRLLNDDLPARVEEMVGLPLTERHLELTISQYAVADAA
ncbi:hypothetical protein [Serinibacter arcticus]|uniref:Uncharacterized protein n=1 Tax=Serinibacter arcticus TaxID=1655435 RepID=A0A4Z1DWH6_9MICO|nr:hypothetical protein [Serinibacter arcticus]TGO03876.1 hypothetical protein SERN_2888 [Serinibacter arcticus]